MENNKELEQKSRELTFGEKAVGLTFNPSGDEKINAIKTAMASVIDIIGDPTATNGRQSWLFNVCRTTAINSCIAASMNAVKFITWKD